MLEKRLLSEARRELHSEEMLDRMRKKDNVQFMEMLGKLDMLIQALTSQKPMPSPVVESKVIVDDSKLKDLDAQLRREREEHGREKKHLLGRHSIGETFDTRLC